MQNYNQVMQRKLGFTLIELAMILVIIGLLVFGIIGSKKLVEASRLSKARSLTNSSAVNGIEDLALWYEATSKDSFTDIQPIDGALIDSWNDINSQNNIKHHANANAVNQRPTYIFNAIANLPALRFNGSSTFLNYDGLFLVGTNYTIFVVEQRRSAAGVSYFIGGGINSTNSGIHLGYINNTTITHGQFGSDYNIGVAAYRDPIPRIHCFIHNGVSGKQYYQNGSNLGSSVTNISPLLNNSSATVGASLILGFYNGDIAEIIIFTRSIFDFERVEVENYLSKKWGIAVI